MAEKELRYPPTATSAEDLRYPPTATGAEELRYPPLTAPANAGLIEESYTAYFATGSAKLDDEAKAVISRALASARDAGEIKFLISGHSDRQGPADFNFKLSQSRVEAVAAAFIEAGVPKSKIETRVFGEDKPALSTADGLSQAQNRRAEIKLVKSRSESAKELGEGEIPPGGSTPGS